MDRTSFNTDPQSTRLLLTLSHSDTVVFIYRTKKGTQKLQAKELPMPGHLSSLPGYL